MSAKVNLLTSFLLKGEKMKELDNLIKSANIDEDYHHKIFGNDIFEKLYTKVDLNKYDSQKNKIYWISLLIYKISMMNYLKYINKDKNISYKETIKVIFKSLIPALSMLVVLLIINHFIPLDVYKKFDAIILIIINAIIGGIIYIYLSFKLNIPYQIFGKEYLNKIIKKLTFGKLKID